MHFIYFFHNSETQKNHKFFVNFTKKEISCSILECEMIRIKHLIRGIVLRIIYIICIKYLFISFQQALNFAKSPKQKPIMYLQWSRHKISSYIATKYFNSVCCRQIWKLKLSEKKICKPRLTSTIEWVKMNKIRTEYKKTFSMNPNLAPLSLMARPIRKITIAIRFNDWKNRWDESLTGRWNSIIFYKRCFSNMKGYSEWTLIENTNQFKIVSWKCCCILCE